MEAAWHMPISGMVAKPASSHVPPVQGEVRRVWRVDGRQVSSEVIVAGKGGRERGGEEGRGEKPRGEEGRGEKPRRAIVGG